MPFSKSDNFANCGLEYAYSVGMSNQIATGWRDCHRGRWRVGGIISNNFITSTVRSHFSSFGEIKLNVSHGLMVVVQLYKDFCRYGRYTNPIATLIKKKI
jgi:hypothetical protein